MTKEKSRQCGDEHHHFHLAQDVVGTEVECQLLSWYLLSIYWVQDTRPGPEGALFFFFLINSLIHSFILHPGLCFPSLLSS